MTTKFCFFFRSTHIEPVDIHSEYDQQHDTQQGEERRVLWSQIDGSVDSGIQKLTRVPVQTEDDPDDGEEDESGVSDEEVVLVVLAVRSFLQVERELCDFQSRVGIVVEEQDEDAGKGEAERKT